MNHLDPRPSLGSVPTAADRARYNAWAVRNGEQPLAMPRIPATSRLTKAEYRAPQAPQAPPPPPPPPPRGPPEPDHVNPDVSGIWRRGTYVRDRTEFAVTTAGRARMLRTWNARRKKWNWTPAGIDYYKHNRQRLTADIPCLGYIAGIMARALGQGANEHCE